MFSKANRRRALWLSVTLIVYTLVILAYLLALVLRLDSSWLATFAVIHLVVALLVVLSMGYFYLQTDELKQRVQAEAFSFAFGGTSIVVAIAAFLESTGIFSFSWTLLFPVMLILWVVGMLLAERRYE